MGLLEPIDTLRQRHLSKLLAVHARRSCISSRPGFVDSPFGHDGKVARLAGGLNWFASVELLRVEGGRRVASELVPVEGIESRFDDAMAADWAALTGARAPLVLGSRTIRLDQPQVMGIVNATPDSFSDGGTLCQPGGCRGGGQRHGGRRRGDHRCRRRIDQARRETGVGRRRGRAGRAGDRAAWRQAVRRCRSTRARRA